MSRFIVHAFGTSAQVLTSDHTTQCQQVVSVFSLDVMASLYQTLNCSLTSHGNYFERYTSRSFCMLFRSHQALWPSKRCCIQPSTSSSWSQQTPPLRGRNKIIANELRNRGDSSLFVAIHRYKQWLSCPGPLLDLSCMSAIPEP